MAQNNRYTFICYVYDDIEVRASIMDNETHREMIYFKDDHYTGGERWVDIFMEHSIKYGTYVETLEEDGDGYFFQEYYRYDF